MSGVATAIVVGSAITGKMSADAQKSAAEGAAGAQLEATEAGIAASREELEMQLAQQKEQFETIQRLLAPYIEAGETALTSQLALSGLAGEDAQRRQIAGIEESPLFQSLTEQGEQAILQRGSATGGLRGGDIQGALAQFRPAMLKQEIESKYAKLGGIAGMGQASSAGVGAAAPGPMGRTNIPGMIAGMGDITAQNILAQGAAEAGMWGDIGGSIGLAAALSRGYTPGLPAGSGAGGGGTTPMIMAPTF
jgi:hypothetical protein